MCAQFQYGVVTLVPVSSLMEGSLLWSLGLIKSVVPKRSVLETGRTRRCLWRQGGAEQTFGLEGRLRENTEGLFLSTDGMGNCVVAPCKLPVSMTPHLGCHLLLAF